QTKSVSAKADLANSTSPPPAGGPLQVIFRADPTIHDGRFANNGWLQELPKPLTKVTWDNVALVSPNTAKRLGLSRQNYEEGGHGREAYVDTIKLSLRDKTITQQVPAWVMPGQPDDVITIHFGYGRTRAGRVANTTVAEPDFVLPRGGFNAYDIRFSYEPWLGSGAQISKTNERFVIASTQAHFLMREPAFSETDRDILRESSIDEYVKDREALKEEALRIKQELSERSLYPDFDYKNQGRGYAWGMSIDLNSCVGCNACM